MGTVHSNLSEVEVTPRVKAADDIVDYDVNGRWFLLLFCRNAIILDRIHALRFRRYGWDLLFHSRFQRRKFSHLCHLLRKLESNNPPLKILLNKCYPSGLPEYFTWSFLLELDLLFHLLLFHLDFYLTLVLCSLCFMNTIQKCA